MSAWHSTNQGVLYALQRRIDGITCLESGGYTIITNMPPSYGSYDPLFFGRACARARVCMRMQVTSCEVSPILHVGLESQEPGSAVRATLQRIAQRWLIGRRTGVCHALLHGSQRQSIFIPRKFISIVLGGISLFFFSHLDCPSFIGLGIFSG